MSPKMFPQKLLHILISISVQVQTAQSHALQPCSKTQVILIQQCAPSNDTLCSICIHPTKTATAVLNIVTYQHLENRKMFPSQ